MKRHILARAAAMVLLLAAGAGHAETSSTTDTGSNPGTTAPNGTAGKTSDGSRSTVSAAAPATSPSGATDDHGHPLVKRETGAVDQSQGDTIPPKSSPH